jgi:excinuclease ABC subunit A
MEERPGNLRIVGARAHNLKNVSLEIPKNAFVVFTGVSGSGKSSLAFDTLFAEGQRRYVESLSSYARQFLGQMEKPPYDHIYGLSPTISIDQKSVSRNPRSTVGTITEIHDYLRVLFARLGTQHCYKCGRVVGEGTSEGLVKTILEMPEGAEILILAPIIKMRKGEHRDVIENLKSRGFARLRVNGVVTPVENVSALEKNKKHTIEAVVDRLRTGRMDRKRLTDSVETAVKTGGGEASIYVASEKREIKFSTKRTCVDCGIPYPELQPNLFSYNNPLGMCVECNGLGLVYEFDPARIIPDETISCMDGAILVWSRSVTGNAFHLKFLRAICRIYGVDPYTPYRDLPDHVRRHILYGSRKHEITVRWDRGRSKGEYRTFFEGVIPMMKRLFSETKSEGQRRFYASFMSNRPCEKCGGARLRPEACAVLVGGKSIVDISNMPVSDALDFFGNLKLEGAKKTIGAEIIKEIRNRFQFLNDVGLSYLSLYRESPTLSAGESQRIRLASQIGSELTGVLYILDEPSIGLHQRDNARLLSALKHLRDIGNSVIVVEHDTETIRNADFVVDFGPGAGIQGGEIVATGPLEKIEKNPKSLTGEYLSGKKSIPIPAERRISAGGKISIRGAAENNLKNLDVEIPLGVFTVITGVSGAGKSSLVNQTLYPALMNNLHDSRLQVGKHAAIRGIENIDKVINIDQSPIGRTPRSNPATYTKVFDPIRDLFSMLPASKTAGYKPGRFSFNVPGGRCENCEGDGFIQVEMHFLADVFVPCEVCGGKRFNAATLDVKFKNHSIAEILDLSVLETMEIFKSFPKISKILKTLDDVGMGYVKLGQPSPTLSGGEAQRIKLSRELAKRSTGRTLYILDEPSTGLHLDDIVKLLKVLERLVSAGNTVVVIEHNLDIIKVADWIIDLGPEGGDAGGTLVAAGTPEEIARNPRSYTGHFLKKVLETSRRAEPSRKPAQLSLRGLSVIAKPLLNV